MYKGSKNLLKNIKHVNINKKYPLYYSSSSNESDEYRNINDKKKGFSLFSLRKNNLLHLLNSNERTRTKSAIHKDLYKLNYCSKSTITMEKRKIKIYINNNHRPNSLLNSENKENKQNQVNLIFNNSIINNCCNNQISKLNTYFLKLNKVYNPHHNYYKIVKNEENIIRELLSQTNNNFNNIYKIIYSNPDSKKRNDIIKSFKSIRENRNKNIDRKNQIRIIATKELYKNKNNNKVNISTNTNDKIFMNKKIKFPPAFNMKAFVYQTNKMKIKTMKMIDEISKNNNNNYTTIYFCNKYNLKYNNDFFKTIPKDKQKKFNG